jgi:hypothetical protein
MNVALALGKSRQPRVGFPLDYPTCAILETEFKNKGQFSEKPSRWTE